MSLEIEENRCSSSMILQARPLCDAGTERWGKLRSKPSCWLLQRLAAEASAIEVKFLSNLHDSYAQYRRTYRVFNENGRLMIEALGQAPERLLKQEDGSFATRSSARNRISFVMRANRAVGMKMTSQGGLPLSGDRVGDGDPQTFHQRLQ
jgi:hypothetical protein